MATTVATAVTTATIQGAFSPIPTAVTAATDATACLATISLSFITPANAKTLFIIIIINTIIAVAAIDTPSVTMVINVVPSLLAAKVIAVDLAFPVVAFFEGIIINASSSIGRDLLGTSSVFLQGPYCYIDFNKTSLGVVFICTQQGGEPTYTSSGGSSSRSIAALACIA